MKNYEVTLEITTKNTTKFWEFRWNGDTLRSNSPYVSLLLEANDQEDVLNTVVDLSENTLKVTGIIEVDEEDEAVVSMLTLLTQIETPAGILADLQERHLHITLN